MVKEEIIKRAHALGISEIGFCRHRGKAAVCCLFPYYVEGEVSRISVYARGRDYHKVVREKLAALMSPFDPDSEIFSDIGPNEDIYIAQKCGLGVKGRNGLLINKNLGSWFFIGYALTSLSAEPDEPSFSRCVDCGKCMNACPGGAIGEKFVPEKCASYLTQKKGCLSPGEEAIVKKSGFVFGCDICQSVCPMNRGKGSVLPEFCENRILGLDLSELSSISNREFMRRYGSYAFSWRGKAPLIRNLGLFKLSEEVPASQAPD